MQHIVSYFLLHLLLSTLTDNNAIPECDVVDITESDLFHDQQLDSYLISCAFSPVTEILILETKYQSKML